MDSDKKRKGAIAGIGVGSFLLGTIVGGVIIYFTYVRVPTTAPRNVQ